MQNPKEDLHYDSDVFRQLLDSSVHAVSPTMYQVTNITGSRKRPFRDDEDDDDVTPSKLKFVKDEKPQDLSLEEMDAAQPEAPFFILPVELRHQIFGYLSHREHSEIRLVCRSFKRVSESILNSVFRTVQTDMQLRFKHIKEQMPRRESLRRKHFLARECDIIDSLHMRLTLLQMTFGRHIERGHCCFFPGGVLDEIKRIVRYVNTEKCIGRTCSVTNELFDLSSMAMEHFKEKIEPVLPAINYLSEFSELNYTSFTPSKSSSPAESPGIPPLEPLTPPSPPSPAAWSALRRTVRKQTADTLRMRREMRAARHRIGYQQRLLREVNTKLEQHDRRFEEQSRRLEALLK